MTANDTLLQKKYSRIVEAYAEKYGVSLETALSRFYKSNLYTLIRDGVSDMHCMSDDYLAEELNEELSRKCV